MKKQIVKPGQWLFAAIIALMVMVPVGVQAATKTKTNSSSSSSSSSSGQTVSNLSSSLTQSYNAASSVETGMIVELAPKESGTVIPLLSSDEKDLLGVVVPANNATIVLTPTSASQQQVLVATSGHYNVLVSSQNGPIRVGDFITISAIAGVGMKADDNDTEVLGKAAGAFTGSANVIGTVSLKNTIGKVTKVSIGIVPVDMYISHNPLFQKTADYVPGFLAKIAVTIADKPVSVARIYLCSALLILTALVVGNMLYSGVRSGMIAVGRNPLSKKSIIRSLIQTVFAGLIIFAIGILAVYLLLKL